MGPLVSFRRFGLTIRVRLATVVVFIVVVAEVSSRTDRSGLAELAIAIAVAGALIGAIAVHETVRAWTYRACGVRVRGLDLTVTGGSPRIADATNSPRAEMLAGIAGLIAISAVGAAALAIELTASIARDMVLPIAIGICSLAIAQTLPALPFDSGRIFRALVWYLTDDPVRGSQSAATYGHLIAAGMIASGALLLTQHDTLPYWGFGLTVAGFQIVTASAAAVRDAIYQRDGKALAVETLGLPWPRRIGAVEPIDLAVDALVAEGDDATLLVTDAAGAPVGFVRTVHLRRLKRSTWPEHRIEEIMAPIADLPVMADTASTLELLELLDDRGATLAVVSDQRGGVRFADRKHVLAHLLDHTRTLPTA